MNDLMSFGLHRLWKDALVAKLRPPRHRRFEHLDVAGGTGDVAFRVVAAAGEATRVTVVDVNSDMLRVGAARARKRARGDQVRFLEGNAEALPLPDAAYAAYTIAFGLRNVPRVERALGEAFRVLKRGGHFFCLEFSRVDVPVFDRLYAAYSQAAIPALGAVIAGDRPAYQYLIESIRKFPPPDRLAEIVAAAGFARGGFVRLTGGVVAIHSGWKL